MKIYKFKDNIDGRYCFIMAKSKDAALRVVDGLTSIPVTLVDEKRPEELTKPIVIMNEVLPF
jgi:hypothetical protein